MLLARLYRDRADEIAARLDALIAAYRRPPRRPDRWDEHDAWLIAYPDQFGGPGRPLVELERVVAGLAPALNGVHVLPFHPSSSDGGFSVEDHAVVDPSLGDWDDIDRLGASHRLMADAVINHVSARGTWFRSFLEGDPERQSWFRVVEQGTDTRAVVRPRPGRPVARVDHVRGPVDVWATFSADQIDLDFREPAVLLEVFEAVFRYVEHGAAAVRLDAVAFLWKDPAGPSIHLPETHAVVALLRSCLDEIDPSVVLVTETNVAHEENIAYLGTEGEPEAHAVYQFSLPPLVLHAVTTGDTGPLVHWAEATQRSPGTTVLNFLASHDGIGLRPARGWLSATDLTALADRCRAVGGEVNVADGASGPEPYELAATWWALCGGGDESDTLARFLTSHAVALALQGIPLLYAHSLVGSGNDTATAARTGLSRDLNRARFSDGSEFLAALSASVGRPARVWAGLSEMLRRRRALAAFHPDSGQRVAGGPGHIVIERGGPEGRALVIAEFAGSDTEVSVPGGRWRHGDGTPVADTVVVPALGSVWLHTASARPAVSAS